MSRDLSTDLAAEVVKQVYSPVMFFEGLFDSGPLRFWNRIGTIVWNGAEWFGAGDLIGVTEIGESQELKAVGISVTLSGIPSSIISIALAEDYQGRRCRIWFGAISETGHVIAAPVLIFGGTADVMEIDENAATASITLSVESRLIDLERARQHRYEHEDQLSAYPGDLGLQYVPSIQDTPIMWGRS